MKNIEKYKDEILKEYKDNMYIIDAISDSTSLGNALFSIYNRRNNDKELDIIEWLTSEYKEPILTDEGIEFLKEHIKQSGATAEKCGNWSRLYTRGTRTMIDKPTRLVPNKHYKKEVLMMCDKQDIIDYCHEMEQRFFQAMLIIDKLMEREQLNEKDKALLEEIYG